MRQTLRLASVLLLCCALLALSAFVFDYGVMWSSGTRTSTHYNLQVGGETALMVKEHAVEAHGVPDYTVAVGGSGASEEMGNLAIIAGLVMITFGIAAIAMGVNGRSEVRSAIAEQKITATPDAGEITNGRLKPGEAIKTGAQARAFADVMEHHALESTGGKRYAEMGRFLTADGKETSDESQAAKDPKSGQPVENGLRNLWVTETALTTALNTSFFAERVAVFSIVIIVVASRGRPVAGSSPMGSSPLGASSASRSASTAFCCARSRGSFGWRASWELTSTERVSPLTVWTSASP
jgi:hypothetical protein